MSSIKSFNKVQLDGPFQDPTLPAGFAPFAASHRDGQHGLRHLAKWSGRTHAGDGPGMA